MSERVARQLRRSRRRGQFGAAMGSFPAVRRIGWHAALRCPKRAWLAVPSFSTLQGVARRLGNGGNSLKPKNTASAAEFRNASLGECGQHQPDDGGHAEPGKQVFEAAAVVRIVLHGVALHQESPHLVKVRGGIGPVAALAAAATVRAPVRGVVAWFPVGISPFSSRSNFIFGFGEVCCDS